MNCRSILLIPIVFCIISMLVWHAEDYIPRAVIRSQKQNLSDKKMNDPVQNPWNNTVNATTMEKKNPGNSHEMIYMRQRGRLGNVLFEYAMLLAVKNLTGRPVTFVCFTNVSTIFQGMSIPIVYPTNIILNKLRHLPKTRERAAGYFQLSFIANIPSYDVVICCYFQAFKYFYFMRDTVKKEFTFRKHYKKPCWRRSP